MEETSGLTLLVIHGSLVIELNHQGIIYSTPNLLQCTLKLTRSYLDNLNPPPHGTGS